jgi:hypothetical protein
VSKAAEFPVIFIFPYSQVPCFSGAWSMQFDKKLLHMKFVPVVRELHVVSIQDLNLF